MTHELSAATTSLRAFMILGVLLSVACSRETAPDLSTNASAPAMAQAVTIMEPPRIEIGETARIEVAVSVPPGTRVTALQVPEETPGLWVIEAEAPKVESHPGREIHSTQFRVRARATGTFAWPGGEILAFTESGEELRLPLAPRPFRVTTVSDELPGQRTFFSYQQPSTLRGPGGPGGVLVPGLIGALLAYASVALLAFVWRARRVAEVPVQPPIPATAPWRAAQAALAAAAEIAEQDPVRGADMASGALRHYIDGRFGSETGRATTEELFGIEAPFLLTTRWGELLELLVDLDRERFPPPSAEREAQLASLRGVIARAQRFITDAAPRGDVT